MSSESEILTGNAVLDRDIDRLIRYLSSEQFKKLSEQKEQLDEAEIESLIEKRLLYLIFTIFNPFGYNRLITAVSEDSKEKISNLRKLWEEKLSPVLSDTKVNTVINRIIAEQEKKRQRLETEFNPFDKVYNVPEIVDYRQTYFRTPPNLLPGTRVVILGEKNRILVELSVDWLDISFLIERFTAILQESFEQNRELYKLKQVIVSDNDSPTMRKNIESAKENLEKTQSLFKEYNI